MIKKHKKLLIRIGSILACVLFVAGLALPCFALDRDSSYREILEQVVVDSGNYNPAFANMISNIVLQNSNEGVNQKLSSITNLVTGYVDTPLTDAYWFPTPYTKPGGFPSNAGFGVPDIGFSFWCSINGQEYSYFTEHASITAVIEYGDDGVPEDDTIVTGYILVTSTDGQTTHLLVGIQAKFVSLLNAQGYSVSQLLIMPTNIYMVGGSTLVNPNGENFAFCFWDSFSVADNFIQYTLLNDDTIFAINPRSLFTGWIEGIANAGATEEDLQDAYNQGYSAGESVAFGEQLLGDSFKTPFEMLQRFTLFEWTDDVGNHHSINLAIVLGAGIGIVLFVWFLKLFAGG